MGGYRGMSRYWNEYGNQEEEASQVMWSGIDLPVYILVMWLCCQMSARDSM